MFSTYDIQFFSSKIFKIRKDLGYSREYVSKASGVNTDTIRKIEKGDVLPRFETLELLSFIYKVNLIQLLDQCKSSTTLSYFYDSVDYYISRNDILEIRKVLDDFLSFYDKKNNQMLLNPNEVKQLALFFEAIDLLYSNDTLKYPKGLERLHDAIRVTINTFDLDSWENFIYNQLEIRILYCIASTLIYLDRFQLSIDILVSILDRFDFTAHSNLNEKFTIIKTYSLISYNHHMLDNYRESLEYANLGIEYCQKNSIMHNLPLLLSRKGVALYNLESSDFKTYLDYAVHLLNIQDNHKLAELYLDINKHYIENEHISTFKSV